MARTLLVCAFVCLALTLPPPAAAQASRTKEYSLDISRQPLTRALEQLNHQTGLYYAYIPASPEEERMLVGPLKGDYQIDKALNELLQSTELTFEWTAAKTVSIVRLRRRNRARCGVPRIRDRARSQRPKPSKRLLPLIPHSARCRFRHLTVSCSTVSSSSGRASRRSRRF